MSDCVLTDTCIFFNDKMAGMPATADMYKKRYCHDDFASCARYRVYKKVGRENVPADLFPNEKSRVEQVVEGAHT